MSSEAVELLQRMADASGMNKQDHLIDRVLCREVTVAPNKRMQRYMEEGMMFVCKELRRLEDGSEVSEGVIEFACMLGDVFAGLGRDVAAEFQINKADMIMGIVR